MPYNLITLVSEKRNRQHLNKHNCTHSSVDAGSLRAPGTCPGGIWQFHQKHTGLVSFVPVPLGIERGQSIWVAPP